MRQSVTNSLLHQGTDVDTHSVNENVSVAGDEDMPLSPASDPAVTNDNLTGITSEEPESVLNSGVSYEIAKAMLLNLWNRHHLSNVAIDDIMQLVNLCVGKKLFPKSWKTLVEVKSSNFQFSKFGFCECQKLYKISNLDQKCDSCLKPMRELSKCGKVFYKYDIRQQLKELTQTLSDSLQLRENTCVSPQLMSDLVDGKLYRKLVSPGELSLSIAVDGVPTANSTKRQIIPIFAYLNELPAKIRKKHPILVSLWEGVDKPPPNLYLLPLVEELNNLFETGLDCVTRQGETVNRKVKTILVTADAPARSWILNSMQFNGYFGCNWCLIEGQYSSGALRYPYKHVSQLQHRTHAENVQHATEATALNPVYGIKGETVLSQIHAFDSVQCLSPEYMHAIVLGIFKSLLIDAYFNTALNASYRVDKREKDLTKKLREIMIPSNIAKPVRSFQDLKYWKAADIEIFTLLYSPYVFANILPKDYYNNLMTLCNAVYRLTKSRISNDDVNMAKYLFDVFLRGCSELLPDSFKRYNFHILQHVAECGRNFGPLNTFSAYGYENDLGKLKEMIKSYKNVPQQIWNKFTVRLKAEQSIRDCKLEHISEEQLRFLNKLVGKEIESHVHVFGDSKVVDFTETEKDIVTQANMNPNDFQCFNKCRVRQFDIYTQEFTSQFKFKNCFVATRSMFLVATKILKHKTNEIWLLCKQMKLHPKRNLTFSDKFNVAERQSKLEYVFIISHFEPVPILIRAQDVIGRVLFIPSVPESTESYVVVPFCQHLC